MSETDTTAPETSQSLDEVLVAMDVVDTLRHRDRIFLREIDTEGREEDLIARLKEIYSSQGMDVPDSVIRDGVRAMADKRYEHTPARPGLMRRLALIYVTRERWWKPVAAGFAAVAVLWGGYTFGVAMPREAREAALQRELTETLPGQLASAHQAVLDVAESEGALETASALLQGGLSAAREGDREAARDAVEALQTLHGDLAVSYRVRIVQAPNEFSGVFRESLADPSVNNFYLIVEAVDAAGRVIEVPITSEEDRSTRRVRRWGQRVSQAVFEEVAADKREDQIIDNAIIGEKPAGTLEPDYSIFTAGGAITEW